jgi:hypothetical protein
VSVSSSPKPEVTPSPLPNSRVSVVETIVVNSTNCGAEEDAVVVVNESCVGGSASSSVGDADGIGVVNIDESVLGVCVGAPEVC